MSESVDSEFTEVVLGPDDFLVLMSRSPLSPSDVERHKRAIPGALHGRILIVDGFDVMVGRRQA